MGWRVRALVRNPQKHVEGVEIIQGDIADSVVLRRSCEGVSAVVHAAGLAHVFGSAAKDFARFHAVNAAGTAKLIDAAVEAGVPHIVLVSSVSVYGDYPGTKCDESVPCHPKGSYATSKWQAEIEATERIVGVQASLTILRFATIYGEGDRGNVARLVGALNRSRFIWPGSGLNQKSLIYKQDAARACLAALERPLSGTKIFNVSARPASMREIVSAICQSLGRPVPRFGISLALLKAVGAISCRMGDPGQFGQRLEKFIHDDVYDGSRFESAFDFRPAISLTEGMRREVEYLQAQTRR
jgi:nucleoside-diphosphate-sugar epimerase